MAEIIDVAATLASSGNSARKPGHLIDDSSLSFDTSNMLVVHSAPVPANFDADSLRTRCCALSQALVLQLFQLPVEKSDVGPLALLSSPLSHGAIHRAMVVPREKPVPKPKPETRWQKFAREHGIQKHKRSRNVLDETTGEYLPRWGRGSIRKTADDAQWVIEEKEHPADYIPAASDTTSYEDPFQKNKAEKKRQREEQQRRERRNIASRTKEDARAAFAATSLTAAAGGIRSSMSMSHARLNRAVKLAQKSTRSMGDFDEHRPDEPAIKKRKKPTKSRSPSDEKTASLKVLDKVIRKDTDTSANISGAVNKLMDQERTNAKRRKVRE